MKSLLRGLIIGVVLAIIWWLFVAKNPYLSPFAKQIIPLIVTVVIYVVGVILYIVIKFKIRHLISVPFRHRQESSVFLSYRSRDATLVRFVAEQMIAQGVHVWFNEYRVQLRGWDTTFEQMLAAGVANTERAIFFTNAQWAESKQWTVVVEAFPLLARLGKENCVEVQIPSHPLPHQVVPPLREVRHIDTRGMDRWTLLRELCQAFDFPTRAVDAGEMICTPLRGFLQGVPYEVNTGGWSINGRTRSRRGIVTLPALVRTEDGITSEVRISGFGVTYCRPLYGDDERAMFEMLRENARTWFAPRPNRGECIGTHLVFNSGLSHGAFTSYRGGAWYRLYVIQLPTHRSEGDSQFRFECAVRGSFADFCRVAWQFDDLVGSLQYGA